jgi:hypothetical protein
MSISSNKRMEAERARPKNGESVRFADGEFRR